MKILNSTAGLTKKDMINARASQPFKDLTDYTTVVAAAIALDVDKETGEEREFGYIFSPDGVYAGSSATIMESLSDVIDLIADGEDVAVRVIQKESKSGRVFYTLSVR